MSEARAKEEKLKKVYEELAQIILVDPGVVSSFVDSLGIQADERQLPEETYPAPMKDVSGVPYQIAYMVHMLMKPYTMTPLGRIVHPHFGEHIIVDRMTQTIQLLFDIVRNRIKKIIDDVRGKAIRGENIKDEFNKVIEMFFLISIIARETNNRHVQLFYINAPPTARSPLINAYFGYEILG